MCGRTNCIHKKEMSLPTIIDASIAVPQPVDDLKTKKSKKVTFFETVRVILVPNIREYKEAQLFNSIWWTTQDLAIFHYDMSFALRKFVARAGCTDWKKTLRLFIEDELSLADNWDSTVDDRNKRSYEETNTSSTGTGMTTEIFQPTLKKIKV